MLPVLQSLARQAARASVLELLAACTVLLLTLQAHSRNPPGPPDAVEDASDNPLEGTEVLRRCWLLLLAYTRTAIAPQH